MKWKRPPIVVLFIIAALATILLAACGEGGGGPAPATPPSGATATPTEAPRLGSEWGEEPIYWRTTTEDGLKSLQTCVEPCIGDKVVFRIANGYAEETLLVVAERQFDGLRVKFEAIRVVTQDNLPGSFYPLNLGLPEPGSWQLYVMAGADEVVIAVEVAPADN